MSHIYLDPNGFLGTGASLLADVALLAYIFLIVPAMIVGFVFARRKKFRPYHKYTMITITIVNWILIIFLMAVAYNYDVADNIGEKTGNSRYLLPTIHAVLGLSAQLLAMTNIYRILREERLISQAKKRGEKSFGKYYAKNIKLPMRVTLVLWLVTASFGIVTYLTRYEVIPTFGDDEKPKPAVTPEVTVPPVATEESTQAATSEAPTAEATEAATSEAGIEVAVVETVEPQVTPEASAEAPQATPETTAEAGIIETPETTPEVVETPETTPEPSGTPAGIKVSAAEEAAYFVEAIPKDWIMPENGSPRYEMAIETVTTEIERCSFSNGEVIRNRVDFDVTVTDVFTRKRIHQVFEGAEPQQCQTTETFTEGNSKVYAGMPDVNEFSDWLHRAERILIGVSVSPVTTPEPAPQSTPETTAEPLATPEFTAEPAMTAEPQSPPEMTAEPSDDNGGGRSGDDNGGDDSSGRNGGGSGG